MGSLVKSLGEWKNSLPYVKADEEWKIPKSAWTKTSDGWKSWFLQSGLNDSGFNESDTNGGLNEHSNVVIAQPDGKTLVGGNFDLFGQVKIGGIVRFNTNGTLDTDFNLNVGSGLAKEISTTAPTNYEPRPSVFSMTLQPDGKIIVSGRFDLFNGVSVKNIVRLNPDGTLDNVFTANSNGFNKQGSITSIDATEIQPDGKILVGGRFTFFNNNPINGFARLNSDGTLDTVFNQTTGTGMTNLDGLDAVVYGIKIQSDNKIVIVGYFKKFNETTVNSLVRLNSNGTIDSSFRSNNGTGIPDTESIDTLAIQLDGKIIFSGSFSSFNGADLPSIVRLNSNGTVDTSFAINRGQLEVISLKVHPITQKILIGQTIAPFLRQVNPDGAIDNSFSLTLSPLVNIVRSIDIQSDNKIVMAGGFFSNVGRLDLNGVLDNSFLANFSTGFNERVEVVKIQSDDKILVGGSFVAFDDTPLNFIARLNSDGTLDENFKNNNGLGPNGPVLAIETQSDGKIIIGGLFTRFDTDSSQGQIARLNLDGTPDNDFNINTGTGFSGAVGAIAIQSDGKILVGGNFNTFNEQAANRMARLNSDGTLDTSFSVGTGFGAVVDRLTVTSLKIQEDGKIVVTGSFSRFTGILVNRIVRLNSDGSLDTSFNTGSGFSFYGQSLAIQSDGKILVGGLFSTFNGVAVNRLVRLNSDGTLDAEFTNNIGSGTESLAGALSGGVYSLIVQPDGKIFGGGSFEKFNNTPAGSIFSLNPDGTLDESFISNTGAGFDFKVFETQPVNGYAVRSLAIQKDKKIVVGGKFNIFNNINRSNIARIGGDPTTA
jgi:uncharacterized delta-60 repeat protein